jgi:ferredoxin-thioredoxin reductase catalytic subunit
MLNKKMQLNPDSKIVTAIRNRLKITGNFCPCVPETLWDEDYLCPCKNYREKDECHCKLYVPIEENKEDV